MTELSAREYRDLLSSALPGTSDADTKAPDQHTLFTPASHRSALDPDVTVVKGGRGVGKTVWFKALLDEELRQLAADEYQLPGLHRIKPVAGYGSERSPEKYPNQRALEHLIDNRVKPDDIWWAVVLTALEVPDLRELKSWQQRVDWLRDNPERTEFALVEADRSASDQGITKLFLFDALERLHGKREYADQITSGILQVALNLRTSTRRLRAKVFIRHDMLDNARLHFTDASKLTSNAADLVWPRSSLYGLLFQHLGSVEDQTGAKFRALTGQWETKSARYVPPRQLTGDETTQQEIFIRLAGRFMGTHNRKGHTYTWLPNHLADGRNQVSPRSFLSALRTATDDTASRHANHEYALHWDGIRRGVQAASQTRVREIEEDIRWVAIAITPLQGLQVPIEQSDIVHRWTEVNLTGQLDKLANTKGEDATTGPQHPDDYEKLIDELIALGVVTRRANGKLDLPDVYRIAFNIGRRGGVPRIHS